MVRITGPLGKWLVDQATQLDGDPSQNPVSDFVK
jgi:hypothetical protein